MKRRQKRSHSGADVAAAPAATPVATDHNYQINLDPASQPMTSPHDDTYSSAATDSAEGPSTEHRSAQDFAAAGDGRELFNLPSEAQDGPSLGERLRLARERKGLSLDEVCTRLRLPQRVVAMLESNDYARIEHDVYLRGYLASYSRLLEIPVQAVDTQLRDRAPNVPALVATGRISHSRYLFQRYSVPTVYVILTGLIVAPAIWLATHGGLDQNLARLAPLEQPLPAETTAATPLTLSLESTAATPAAAGAATPEQAPPVAAEQPLMASIVPAIKHEPAPAPEAPPAIPSGSYQVRLELKDASWVEMIASNGERVEFGLLPAGSSKTYTLAQPVSVRLGNSANAQLQINGNAVDLAPFRRANVARLKLVDGAAVAPAPAPGDN